MTPVGGEPVRILAPSRKSIPAANSSDPSIYVFEGSYWEFGDQVEIRLALRNGSGAMSTWRGRVRGDTIPVELHVLPGGKGRFEGIGEAAVSASVSHEEAVRRAKGQARQMAATKAIDPENWMEGIVRDTESALAQYEILSRVLTYDEEWLVKRVRRRGGETMVVARLLTRARVLGGKKAPVIRATLRRDRILPGEGLSVAVRSPARAYVGLYLWGADDRITRISPGGNSDSFSVELLPGTSTVLPPPDGPVLSSAPLANDKANTEALVLVVSSQPVDFRALVHAVPGWTSVETAANGVLPRIFLDRLSKLDPRFLTIRYLPYEVREGATDGG